jgi:cell wall-associated NlpC family hydrolase
MFLKTRIEGRYAALVVLLALLVVCLAGCAGRPTAATTTAPGDSRPDPGPGISAADLDSAMEAAGSAGGDPRRSQVLDIAMRELGKRYEWGGNGPDSWDCSGLVKHTFAEVGVGLPRVTLDQVNEGVEVPGDNYEAADLLFFNSNGHVAIYIGRGLMIHAIGDGVQVERVSKYSRRISAARRVLLQPVETHDSESQST